MGDIAWKDLKRFLQRDDLEHDFFERPGVHLHDGRQSRGAILLMIKRTWPAREWDANGESEYAAIFVPQSGVPPDMKYKFSAGEVYRALRHGLRIDRTEVVNALSIDENTARLVDYQQTLTANQVRFGVEELPASVVRTLETKADELPSIRTGPFERPKHVPDSQKKFWADRAAEQDDSDEPHDGLVVPLARTDSMEKIMLLSVRGGLILSDGGLFVETDDSLAEPTGEDETDVSLAEPTGEDETDVSLAEPTGEDETDTDTEDEDEA